MKLKLTFIFLVYFKLPNPDAQLLNTIIFNNHNYHNKFHIHLN